MGYYENCAFPKPVTKKKKLLSNGYKDKKNRVCIYTGQRNAERHEIFGGSNRQISVREKFQIDVCREKHEELQANVTEWAQAENKRLKAVCQRVYMDKLVESGLAEETALEIWMNLIGRNYIEELIPR